MELVRVHEYILEARLDLNRYTERGIAYRSWNDLPCATDSSTSPQLRQFWLSVFHAPLGHVLLGSGASLSASASSVSPPSFRNTKVFDYQARTESR
jgi:hypothetical protein